jgi:hypothetical protein
MTTTSNYALRLQRSLLVEVSRIAAEDDTTVNQFIDVARAEKAAALRTEAYSRGAGRADLVEFERIFGKTGSEPPRRGDEANSDRVPG